MSYKKTDKIFEHMRIAEKFPRIYHPGIELLEESVNRRDFLKGIGALGLVGGATLASLKQDLTPEDVPKDMRSELEKYQDEIKKKGIKNWEDQKLAAKNAPANADGIIKDGFMKGVYNPKIPMKRMIKKYKSDWYQLNPRMVYIHPGALDQDEVLPTTGLTTSQQADYYYSKDILNLHNILYNPNAWPYNPPFDNAPYLYNEKGQIYLPLSWSVAYDVWQNKIYEFLDDVAAKAYIEKDGKYVQKSEEAVKEVMKKYYFGTKNERIYILKEFELSQGDDFKISDYLQDRARTVKQKTDLKESKKRRKIWIRKYN